METLSIEEVSRLLKENGFPEEIIENLQSKWTAALCLLAFFDELKSILPFFHCNFIDGHTLVMLPKDFEEFSHLVPQSTIRMRLKALMQVDVYIC